MAGPCIISYGGKDYPYNEFAALLHDGLLGKMIADGTINTSILKGEMPSAIAAFKPVKTKPKPEAVTVTTPSGKDLSVAVQSMNQQDFVAKHGSEFDSPKQASDYYVEAKEQIFESKANTLKDEISAELNSLANILSINPLGSTKLWSKMASLMGLYFKKGVTTAVDFAKAAGYKMSGAIKDLWDRVTGKVASAATRAIRNAPLKTLNARLYYQAAIQGSQNMGSPQQVLDYIKDQIDVLDVLSIHSTMEESLDVKAATEALKALYQELSIDLNKVNARLLEEQNRGAGVFELGEKLSFLENLRLAFQDDAIWQKKVQDQIEKLKGTLPDDMNPYLKKDIAIGKVQDRIDKVLQKIFGKQYGKLATNEKGKKSLLERMKEKGLSQANLDLYMYAKHAQERNARARVIAEQRNAAKLLELQEKLADQQAKPLTPAVQAQITRLQNQIAEVQSRPPVVEGSGMSDDMAANILDEFERANKADNLEEFAKEFRETVINPAIEAYRESGIITDEEADMLINGESPSTGVKFDYYVPLKVNSGIIADAKGQHEGTGSSKEPKKIKATDKYDYLKRDSPFARAIMDLEDAIKASEENKTKQALYKLIEDNPNDLVWETVSARYMEKNGRMEEITAPDVLSRSIPVMVDGKKKYIVLRNDGLYKAWTRKSIMGEGKTIRTIVNVFRTFNNIRRAVLTTWNPVFATTNLFRDVQDAVFNATGLDNPAIGKIIKNIPKTSRALLKAGLGNLDPNSENGKLLDEYLQAGGKISWMNYDKIEDQLKEIDKLSRKYNKGKLAQMPMSAFKAVLSTVEAFNESIEVATRLSVYKAMRDSGLSTEKAASISKNLTVNFNKKGVATPVLNTLYLFMNAGVQSTAAGFTAVARSKKAKAMSAGLVLAGIALPFIQQAMLEALGDDDEEKEKFRLLVSKEEAEGQYILPLGNGKILRFPKPYGAPRLFFNMGEFIGGAIKDDDYGDVMGNIMGSFLSTVDPIAGNSPNKLSGFTPTMFKPIVEMGMNKDWHNAPIYPTNLFGPPKPDYLTKYENVNPYFDKFTETMYQKTNGGIDVSPETLDFLLSGFGGGVIKELTNGGTQLANKIQKEDVDMNKVPLYSKFVNDITTQQWRYYKGFYDLYNRAGKDVFTEQEWQDLYRYSEGLENGRSVSKKIRAIAKAQNELIETGMKTNVEETED
jgi:hypothetical protein